jgi:antitoxin component YwqK of YwqJK toxin-antitoxin module
MMQYRDIHAKPLISRIKLILIIGVLSPCISNGQQWIDYKLTPRGDTINRVDKYNRKQGPWWFRYEEVRGEPGFEEEGYFYYDKKEGPWKKFSLMGDLIAKENFTGGYRNGPQFYYNKMGDLIREESWKAVDPAKPFDTIMVPDIDYPDRMIKKIIKHESAEIRHGIWKYYDPVMGTITKTEKFVFGQPEQILKPNKNSNAVKTEVKPTPSVSSSASEKKKTTQTQKKGKN